MPSKESRAERVSTKTREKARPARDGRAHAAEKRAFVPADMRRLEQLLAQHAWPEHSAFVRARKQARRRVLDVLETESSQDVARTALLVACTELLVALHLEGGVSAQEAAELADAVESTTGISAIAIARELLRAPELLTVSPTDAIEAVLTMLYAFGPLRGVSLWKPDHKGQATCIHHVGEGETSRRAVQLANCVLAGNAQPTDSSVRSLWVALPVGRRKQPLGVLVASARPSMRERGGAFLGEATGILSSILERELLMSANAVAERALVESSERKLTRLGFDLHDGPIQDVAVLAEDVRLFRGQLEGLIGPLPQGGRVAGRIEDLETQLGTIDSELRRLSSEVQAASVLLNRPFERALRDRVQVFTARTGIQPRLKLKGDLTVMSTSQQIALLNIVQEALNNIREHAGATKVGIALSVDEAGVRAQVVDNGAGFDLERTLMRTAREGRVGLVAMNERVRLLGGQCRIETQPGGPTVVSVRLDRWRPVLEKGGSPRAAARA